MTLVGYCMKKFKGFYKNTGTVPAASSDDGTIASFAN